MKGVCSDTCGYNGDCRDVFNHKVRVFLEETIITVVGALTAYFAATVGVVQLDLKKVVAYSTCIQLGYMVSLFHLMNHAVFFVFVF